jgi:iron(II)-dependent oxidoreductase
MTASVSTIQLAANMRNAHQRSMELLEGLTAEQLIGPVLPTVNPLLWEVGHVAWFHEYFILRREYSHQPLLGRGDALYDSITIAHETRWDLPIYPLDEIQSYMDQVCEVLIGRLGDGLADPRESFLYQFTTFHEDMHDEAFVWARQTHGYPAPTFMPDGPREEVGSDRGTLMGDAEIPGGWFQMGSPPEADFLFDNEKWAHDAFVAPMRMARAPVTNTEFAAFIADGGYERQEYWGADGWRWRSENEAQHPVFWRPIGTGQDGKSGWQLRRFDQWLDLPPDEPVIHVNWYEASAWCRWAGRRLPTEAEWEFAATMREGLRGGLIKARYPWGDAVPTPGHVNLDGFALGPVDVAAHDEGDSFWGCRQMLGNVWEWTADTFGPFPGFSPDDYKEYSEPLFGDTKVLRGGAWTTRARMASSTYRNFFGPERRDVFAGFRTCAL